jgi:hypothetical protein
MDLTCPKAQIQKRFWRVAARTFKTLTASLATPDAPWLSVTALIASIVARWPWPRPPTCIMNITIKRPPLTKVFDMDFRFDGEKAFQFEQQSQLSVIHTVQSIPDFHGPRVWDILVISSGSKHSKRPQNCFRTRRFFFVQSKMS